MFNVSGETSITIDFYIDDSVSATGEQVNAFLENVTLTVNIYVLTTCFI